MANWNLYDKFRQKNSSGNGGVDITTLTVKCLIVTGTYTPDQNLHDFEDDLGANEVSGTNYTAGGNAVANIVDTITGAGVVKLDGDDPATWTQHASGFSNGRRAILYVDRGGAATANELIAYSDDFGADKGNVDGDFTIQLDATNGIFTSSR